MFPREQSQKHVPGVEVCPFWVSNSEELLLWFQFGFCCCCFPSALTRGGGVALGGTGRCHGQGLLRQCWVLRLSPSLALRLGPSDTRLGNKGPWEAGAS